MIVGIDARRIISRRGIGNFVFHLLQYLSKLPHDCTYIIYVDDVNAYKLVPTSPNFVVKVLWPKIYPIWEQIALPFAVNSDKLDILHCPGNSAPVFLPRGVKLVLSIMDVMYMFPSSELPKSPFWYQRIGREYLKYIVPLVAKSAAAITTISSCSKNDILKYINIQPSCISVIWLAANSACGVISQSTKLVPLSKKINLDESFILGFGALDPRKNTDVLLRSFSKFKKESTSNLKLFLVGLSLQGVQKFQCLAEELQISKDVFFSEFVTEEELIRLYNNAEILIYPSLYEGFGLPVLEAMKCGLPVITSPYGSIPEIAGDAAVMVDPNDEISICMAIDKVLSDEVFRNDLVKKGLMRAELFSWELVAEKTFSIYQDVLGKM